MRTITGLAAAAAAAAACILTVGISGSTLAASPAASPPAEDSPDAESTVTVMSRNLYLGADIGVALDLLPDLRAAGQFLWDQVTATDFDSRAPLLAAEAAQHRPDVIGLQEATTWVCTSTVLTSGVPVFDFTTEFLDATRAAGVPYVVAEVDGRTASNPGYQIGPLPGVKMTDPEIFQPLFGKDQANCGFQISDVLLVRQDLIGAVRRVGTSEYEARNVIVPTVMSVDRGYAWADIDLAGTTVRFVTTHLESLWEPDQVPIAATQARQLADDLAGTTGPLLVMGDLNSDPRDPRPEGAPNPATQPTASQTCPGQAADPTLDTAADECSPYWVMRHAGYTSAGPDEFDPADYSWGASELLAGPDPGRLVDALALGNPSGFTDRLDYVFLRNGATPGSGQIVGNVWPNVPELWQCDSVDQVDNTQAAGRVLAQAGKPVPAPEGHGQCLPSDHAGVVATVNVDPSLSTIDDPIPTEHHPFRLVWWHIALVLVLLLGLLVSWLVRRRRRKKRAQAI